MALLPRQQRNGKGGERKRPAAAVYSSALKVRTAIISFACSRSRMSWSTPKLLWYTKVVTFRSDKLEENEQGELTMTKKYSEEFKKQMVQEYLKGTSYPKLSKEYHVAKSTLVGWVKKYSEECQFTKPQTSPSFSENAKEIHELQKRIHELEKENLFLKKAAAFFAKEID